MEPDPRVYGVQWRKRIGAEFYLAGLQPPDRTVACLQDGLLHVVVCLEGALEITMV